MLLLQWPCFWAWTGVKFPHSQYACHSSKRKHQQHHVFKTLYILVCGKIYRKQSVSQTWKVYLSTNLSIQNSIPSNASLCFPSHLPSCVDLAGCSGNRITVLPHGCNRSVEAGIFPPNGGRKLNHEMIRSLMALLYGMYFMVSIYIYIYTYDIWYVLWDSWVLNGFCWVYLNGRILRAFFVLVSPYHGFFFLKTRISPTIHVTISMSWHAIWIEWDGYCRMGWIFVGSEYYGILISLDIMGSPSIWSPFTGYGSSGVTITIHGEFLFDLYLN